MQKGEKEDNAWSAKASRECVLSLTSWYTLVITALRRLRQEDQKFEVSQGYIVRPCLTVVLHSPPSPQKCILFKREKTAGHSGAQL